MFMTGLQVNAGGGATGFSESEVKDQQCVDAKLSPHWQFGVLGTMCIFRFLSAGCSKKLGTMCNRAHVYTRVSTEQTPELHRPVSSGESRCGRGRMIFCLSFIAAAGYSLALLMGGSNSARHVHCPVLHSVDSNGGTLGTLEGNLQKFHTQCDHDKNVSRETDRLGI